MDKSVYIIGGGNQYHTMFVNMGWSVVNNIEDAAFLQFTGGSDVDPDLYGQDPHPRTFFDRSRDDQEQAIFDKYVGEKNMLGICRGGQFLNVINGGKLWQDVSGHAIGGTHPALDLMTGRRISVTSTHHQMMRPEMTLGELICVASQSDRREDDTTVQDGHRGDDCEAVWYDNTSSLCFQPHPEFGGANECREYYFDLIERFFGGNS